MRVGFKYSVVLIVSGSLRLTGEVTSVAWNATHYLSHKQHGPLHHTYLAVTVKLSSLTTISPFTILT